MSFDEVEFIPSAYGGWEAEIEFQGLMVALAVDEAELTGGAQEQIGRVVSDLEALDRVARTALLDANTDDEEGYDPVSLFITHHLDELDKNAVATLFGSTTPSTQVFLAKLVLAAVSFHPEQDDEDEAFATFDYTLPGELTDYMLSVRFDGDSNPIDIDMES